MAQINSTKSREFWRKISGLEELNKRQFAQNQGRALGGQAFIPPTADFLSNNEPLICDFNNDKITNFNCRNVADLFSENPPSHINGLWGLSGKTENNLINLSQPFAGEDNISWSCEENSNKKYIFFKYPETLSANDLQGQIEINQRFRYLSSDKDLLLGFQTGEKQIHSKIIVNRVGDLVTENSEQLLINDILEEINTPDTDSGGYCNFSADEIIKNIGENYEYSKNYLQINFDNLSNNFKDFYRSLLESDYFKNNISDNIYLRTGFLSKKQILYILQELTDGFNFGNLPGLNDRSTDFNSFAGNRFYYEFINKSGVFGNFVDYSNPLEIFVYLHTRFAYMNYQNLNHSSNWQVVPNNNLSIGENGEVAGSTCYKFVRNYRNYLMHGIGEAEVLGWADTGEKANLKIFFNNCKFFGNALYYSTKENNLLKFKNIYNANSITNELILTVEDAENYSRYSVAIDYFNCCYKITQLSTGRTMLYGFNGDKIA